MGDVSALRRIDKGGLIDEHGTCRIVTFETAKMYIYSIWEEFMLKQAPNLGLALNPLLRQQLARVFEAR